MLELKNIYKDYLIDKKPFPALKDITLSFRENEFVCILGPSGCGKTTLLNMIGGLDHYTSGDIVINGKSTKTFKEKDWDNYRNKRIGFIFQSYNLIPHLSILANVELSLTLNGEKRSVRKEKAEEALKKVGLEGITTKKPNQLSGGQMQRVAIARALVNSPDIILADEPTGALDSVTSIQVMDLIKEISKDHLVIMVTHNEDLVNKYATRTIKMKDGVILSDSNPFCEKEEKETIKEEKKKTSMSFLTALSMSLKNLFTKKGRTILTSIAASFGIIGVALVLALSNGFSNYVGRVEAETASQAPLNLPSYTTTTKSENADSINQSKEYPDTSDIYPYINPSSTTVLKYNNFNENYFEYLDYLKENKGLINEYLINYVDYYSLNLITEFPQSLDGTYSSEVRKVNYLSNNVYNSMLSQYTGLPTSLFHPLYGEEEYINESYDLIDGEYPANDSQLVLVVDANNCINFNVLQKLGFYNVNDDSSEVQDSSLDTKVKPLSFDKDIKNKKFKVFSNQELYNLEGTYSMTDGDNNARTLKEYAINDVTNLYNNASSGKELKIVGILRPKKTTTVPLMTLGLCYLKSLQTEIVAENEKNTIDDDYINGIIIKNTNGLGKGNFAMLLNEALKDITNATSTTLLMTNLNNTLLKYLSFIGLENISEPYTSVYSYLTAAQKFGADIIPQSLMENGLTNSEFITQYIKDILSEYNNGDITKAVNDLVAIFAYANSYTLINNVVIFPKDLKTKSELKKALDEFNVISTDLTDKYHAHSESEQINYVDFVSDLTSGIGQMITVISIVLIIFASISLAVSCVMTGIITYTSVLERTKEIGILRAVGARKKDVGRLFEAESTIIGGVSGIIGCAVSYLITIPINQILNHRYPDYNLGNIADLSLFHVLLLVGISIVLTLISGLIPSRIASKKDPVTALRTE